MKELLLADNDYRVFEDIIQKNEILFNECLNFKSTLNLFSKNEDKYLTHFLKDGSSITFYTTMGTIYRADCLSVSEIEILTDTRNENTSQQVSNLVHCNRLIQYIQLVNQNYTIVHHNPLLLDGIDLLSTFQEILNHEMSAGTWYSHSSDTSNIKANVIETRMEIKNGLNLIFTKTFGIILLDFTKEQRKSKYRENQKNGAKEHIEMITISKEKINVEPNIQNQEISEESLDSITNQLIFSTN
ncbi:hypothetical protein BpHYR1_040716 [Brachionus plicatilis]|uniref:Uncharacterized protein n=1 Tax=Brachionus plicatilis TaxID=10195 RepID=A0A3M7T8L4_BRAPC|nr:hypothetical protein BpHYR1_040716 [Brachionus plicatilis]